MSEDDEMILTNTVDAIGRTGAKDLEVGTNDEGEHWYAVARFEGAKMICEYQDDVVDAVLGLYAMLAAGGQCAICERMVALEHDEAGLVDGARMKGTQFQSRVADKPRREYCVRVLLPSGWTTCRRA